MPDRLAPLVGHGLLTRTGDPSHEQKVTYSLTERLETAAAAALAVSA